MGDTYDEANAVTMHQGKILAVGTASNDPEPIDSTGADFALVRYDTDGTLDTTFGEFDPGGVIKTGIVTSDFSYGDEARAVAIGNGGSIVGSRKCTRSNFGRLFTHRLRCGSL